MRTRLLPVLAALNLPTTCTFDAAAVTEAIKHEKKGAAGTITAITVPAVGTFATEETTAQALGAKLPLIQTPQQEEA